MAVGIQLGQRRRRKATGATGPVTDAAITAIRSEGWSLDFTAPPTFDPVGTPRHAVVDRQGFDRTAGTATLRETLVLTQRVRQPWPSQASIDASRVALSDYVYSTDTLVGGASPTNNSVEGSPKPIARWALADRRTVGNTLRLEIVAAHRNARTREQIACVRFTVTDGTTTVTQVVSTSTILGASMIASQLLATSQRLTSRRSTKARSQPTRKSTRGLAARHPLPDRATMRSAPARSARRYSARVSPEPFSMPMSTRRATTPQGSHRAMPRLPQLRLV